MTSQMHRLKAISAALILVTLGAATTSLTWAGDQAKNEALTAQSREKPKPKVIPMKDARLKIELNSTDQDAGVQVFIDAAPWKTMDIFDPDGDLILRSTARGSFREQGGTELFMESAEPNFSDLTYDAFLERFPEGTYQFVGRGLDGEKYVGTANFTHDVPDGPVLVAPLEDALVDLNNTVVMWEAVAAPNGSPIIGYQVLVVKPNTGIKALPKLILDVMMPPTATSMNVPPGFLLPNSTYEWEVLAIEESGNQTLTVGHFQTGE